MMLVRPPRWRGALSGRRAVSIASAIASAMMLLLASTVVTRDASAQDTRVLAPVDTPPPPGVSAALDSARAIRGASLTISLYTYGPSEVFYERFGHAAIGVRDNATGTDYAFNWGLFNFEDPNFLTRFLTGDTKYYMAGFRTDAFNNSYVRTNRSVRQQVLALTPVERAAVQEFVQWNARDENKYYRYDYYQDNCGTRVRDALDRILRGRLHAALDSAGTGRTWRGETARTLAYDLPLYAGIQVALGRHADEPLTRWNEEFLPEHMAEHYASVVLSDSASRRYKLVERDTMLFVSDRVPLPSEAPGWLAMACLLGLTLAGLIAVLADARAKVAQIVLSIVVGLWYLVGGLVGTALLLAATVTKHAPYMGTNSTLLSLNPVLLFAAVIVPVALWRRTPFRAAVGLSTLVAALTGCGLLAQLVPSWAQSSGVVLAVVVPVHVAVALALWRLRRVPSPRA